MSDINALRAFLEARVIEDFGRLLQVEPGNEADARAFAETEAKLWILELPPTSVSTDVLELLAYVYETHPDFDPSWDRPEPHRPLDWSALGMSGPPSS